MKTKFSLSSICILLLLKVFGSDSTSFTCKYRFTKLKDSTKSYSTFSDIMLLTIKKNNTIYYSYLKQLGVRNLEDDFRKGVPLQQTLDNSGRYFANQESEIIEINHIIKGVKVSDKFSYKSCYIYNDLMEVPQWNISLDTLTILNQLCQKATTFYKGRFYNAWFAPSIPYQFGPWYFNGLPGLILKVVDEKKQFMFECLELNVSEYTTKVFKPYDGCLIVNAKKLQSMKRMSIINPVAFMQAESGKTVTQVGGDGTPIKRPDLPYNPIDLTNINLK